MTDVSLPARSQILDALRKRRLRDWREGTIGGVLLFCTLVSVLTTIRVIVVLGSESFSFFATSPAHRRGRRSACASRSSSR